MPPLPLLASRGAMAAILLSLATFARADDVGCTSTTFNLFSPNDKVCVLAFNDPDIAGVTCHISQAKTGGWKGAVGVADTDGGDGAPSDGGRVGAVGSLRAEHCGRGVPQRDVQKREEASVLGPIIEVRTGDLLRHLAPIDGGVAVV